ncbi:phage/plasmid primase, P4 family [Lactobacillus delbrueckii subsp. lactis]|uniref:phage/plasmid primase, P4 family n=1 Tax=Lactobacillus delbrueckii TaxID=1584 RepID=UPI001E54063A|nr:phage/plasmid primase, P4 family [Lactobacillus delbrueckii]MCD5538666.1 phage/plasmid primase, P4 family [Lactobacillus delbrueckii subsp. lactis]MCD5546884.1 phage/plasmid primase, P4 family [Lactobacillus delbrueckii subsp. lactis]MCD5548392.1 phage/plasmid primase, P4 family [Lactobacillus delbrueckii subsp. lactis]MCD5550821.1 phage/plasmid primase, P4 family [Lactobacillus delbrueckii subsp. lactis]MCD5558152.1 phage/plasmid primase, P4 family [Lactobacillus delbrueckii subsp. lactis]
MYTGGRYVAFTGNQVSNSDSILALTESEIKAIVSYCGFKWTGKEQAKEPLLVTTPQPTGNGRHWGADNGLTAEQVLSNAIFNNPELKAVASGDYSAYNGDHSSAVQALVNSLAFYANGDAAKTDQAYRSTPSFTDDTKWDASRGDTTWGAQTIAKAINYVQTKHPDHGYFPARQNSGMRVVEPGERATAETLKIKIDGVEREFPFNGYFYNRDYEMTEVGFANRFADWYAKGKLVYHPGLKAWLMYNPETGSWMPNEDDRLGTTFNQTPEKLIDNLRVNLKKEKRLWLTVGRDPHKPDKQSFGEKAYNKGYERISSAAGQKATLELAQSRLTVRAFNDCKTELNTRTGWIDLKTGAISPHSPAKLFDKATDAGLPNKATEGDGGKLWDRFLKETFCGDLELIDYVQACIGYSVTGKINEEVMFICEGSGGNGKSIFLECINEVLGDYSSVIPIETLIDNNKAQRDGSAPSPDLASLKGKRFVMTTEPKKQVTIDDGIVKTVTGGTKLNVRMLHQNPIVFLPQFKIWWQSNGLPRIAIKEHSMLRRLIVIPFKNEVRGDAVDINLKSKLMKEKEFILKWCIEGVAKWQARDGKALYHPKYQPAAVEEATAGLWNSAHVPVDSIKQWLENGNYEEGHSSTPPKVKEVYEDYLAYCKEHELKVPSAYTKQGFNKELARRGHHKRPGTGNSYVWISLKKRG